MFYRVGTLLNINGMDGKVIGYIRYRNPDDGNKSWTEYRLRTSRGECWLSCDEEYNEYSISWPANDVRGQIGPEWHKVDEGTQVVQSSGGDVDVDPGERASFVEYEDATEDHTLSVEIWSDGTEFSKGEYIEQSSIIEKGYEASRDRGSDNRVSKLVGIMVVFMVVCSMGSSLLSALFSGGIGSTPKISDYLGNSSSYVYETSITGNEQQQAMVYKYYTSSTTDTVAMDIIQGVDGATESVTQNNDTADAEIGILTTNEYCLVYHPEDDKDVVYVQVSDRKYNYTSDHSPYRSSSSTTSWYRSHYYSSGYSSDASSYSSTPSAYSMYNGSTIHNIGNGYFDSYSSSIRQSSVNNRSSSGGGLSSGK
ncbi:MAG: DUF4178 domain-containing protein [Lachnospiraceae bacterium]|nr:DUF4178 domain-containing protein [Lachnospiraceae bacterium]